MRVGQPFNPFHLFVGSFIPGWLERRLEISPGAKLCYARLCRYAGKLGVAFPDQRELADSLGVTDRQVRRYYRELQSITVEGARTPLIHVAKRGRGRTALVTFLLHPWMGLDAAVDNVWRAPANRTDASALDRTFVSGPLLREPESAEENQGARRRRTRPRPAAPPSRGDGKQLVRGMTHALQNGHEIPGVARKRLAAVRARVGALHAAAKHRLEVFARWLVKSGATDDAAQAIIADLLSRPEITNPYAYYAQGSPARKRIEQLLR